MNLRKFHQRLEIAGDAAGKTAAEGSNDWKVANEHREMSFNGEVALTRRQAVAAKPGGAVFLMEFPHLAAAGEVRGGLAMFPGMRREIPTFMGGADLPSRYSFLLVI